MFAPMYIMNLIVIIKIEVKSGRIFYCLLITHATSIMFDEGFPMCFKFKDHSVIKPSYTCLILEHNANRKHPQYNYIDKIKHLILN